MVERHDPPGIEHIVAQGDSIVLISESYGRFTETLWKHPDNVELKKTCARFRRGRESGADAAALRAHGVTRYGVGAEAPAASVRSRPCEKVARTVRRPDRRGLWSS